MEVQVWTVAEAVNRAEHALHNLSDFPLRVVDRRAMDLNTRERPEVFRRTEKQSSHFPRPVMRQLHGSCFL